MEIASSFVAWLSSFHGNPSTEVTPFARTSKVASPGDHIKTRRPAGRVRFAEEAAVMPFPVGSPPTYRGPVETVPLGEALKRAPVSDEAAGRPARRVRLAQEVRAVSSPVDTSGACKGAVETTPLAPEAECRPPRLPSPFTPSSRRELQLAVGKKDLVAVDFSRMSEKPTPDELVKLVASYPSLLFLSGVPQTNAHAAALEGARLRRLELTGLPSYQAALDEKGLASIGGMKTLEELEIAGDVGDAAMPHLAKLERLAHLGIAVDFPEKDVLGAEGLRHLRRTNISSLRLTGRTRLREEELFIITRMPKLRALDVSRCGVGDGDMIVPSGKIDLNGMHYLGHSRITSLNVSKSPGITDRHLSALRCAPIEALDAAYCDNVTDAGVEKLRELPLKHLDLHNCENVDKRVAASIYRQVNDRYAASNPPRLRERYEPGTAAALAEGYESWVRRQHAEKLAASYEFRTAEPAWAAHLSGVKNVDKPHAARLTRETAPGT